MVVAWLELREAASCKKEIQKEKTNHCITLQILGEKSRERGSIVAPFAAWERGSVALKI